MCLNENYYNSKWADFTFHWVEAVRLHTFGIKQKPT